MQVHLKMINIEVELTPSFKYTLRLFALAMLIKCLIPLLVYVFQWLDWVHPSHPFTLGAFHLNEWLIIYSNSDSGWYQTIAEHGYANLPDVITQTWSNSKSHFAFFPLYPISIQVLMSSMHLDFHAAAFLVSMACLFLLSHALIQLYTALKFESAIVFKMAVLSLLFPLSLHLFFNYTEAMFLSLLCLAVASVIQKHFKTFLLCLVCLALCRPNGLFLLLPFFVLILEQQALLSLKAYKQWFTNKWVWACALLPLTFAIWMYMQWLMVGDALAFSHAQSSWNKHFMFPLLALFRQGFWDYQLVSWYCLLLITYAFWVRKQLPISFNLLIWINILLPLSAGSVVSMMRYSSVLFPLHMLWQKRLSSSKYLYPLILMFVLIQLLLLKFWAEGQAIMY